METTAKTNSNASIPSFADYTEDRKYLKNVSPQTLAWLGDVWKAFGPHLEPLLASGDSLNIGLRTAITALLTKGLRPISVNSYLTGVRAYLNWLHQEGFLKEKPKVQLLKCEQKVIATFSPEYVQSLVMFKPKGKNQTRAHMVGCLLLDTGLRVAEALGTVTNGPLDGVRMVEVQWRDKTALMFTIELREQAELIEGVAS